ncbi:MAG TPA: siroheme synthase CysG [Xanthobacteraceae bacterium]|nr:siroheme synthase CysG [Xanthobacteraceae bacterium]
MRPVEVQRHPQPPRSHRMQPLARLPIFFELEGKRAIVAGDGAPVAWKAELLSATGANVEVFAEHPCEELCLLAAQAPRGSLTLRHRRWQPEDFAGAAVSVGGFEDETDAEQFAGAARAAGVPVNVIDRPAYCDFSFGAIVNRSPLVIGISTDGAAPVFAQAIRAKLEAMIPRGLSRWAEAARRWRRMVQSSALSPAARRRFWQLFAAFAVNHPGHEPTQSDFDALFGKTNEQSPEAGTVTLVGAGPGDPELLTLRALRALQSAEIILIDDLVAPEILDFARREAKKMLVGKTGHGGACKQDEINALMIALAKAGRRVVRLKGGDPLIFARATEEIAACHTAGISVEIIPGISAAQGAAARLGVPLTQRRDVRRLQYVTGHDVHGRLPEDIDWASLADPAATTVVYMPKKTIGELAARAIAEGLSPDMPAVAVAAATRPEEMIVAGTVSDIAARLGALAPGGPVLVFIGRVFQGVAAAGAPSCEVESARVMKVEEGQGIFSL